MPKRCINLRRKIFSGAFYPRDSENHIKMSWSHQHYSLAVTNLIANKNQTERQENPKAAGPDDHIYFIGSANRVLRNSREREIDSNRNWWERTQTNKLTRTDKLELELELGIRQIQLKNQTDEQWILTRGKLQLHFHSEFVSAIEACK